MDIYKFAMQMELDGRHFYLDLAKKTKNAGIKSVLTMMAESEAKHYNVILDMQKNDKTEYSKDVEVLTKIKNVFSKMKEEKEIDVENAGNLDEKTYEQTTEIINEGGEAAFSC